MRFPNATRVAVLLWLAGCNPDSGLKVYNTPPEVAILAPADGSSVAAGFPVRFEASVKDDQTDLTALTLQFSLDDGTVLTGELSYTENGVVLEAEKLPTGDRLVTLTAIDGSGESGTDTVALTVREDAAPTIQFVAPTDGASFAAEDPLRVDVLASDADETLLSDLSLSWGDAAANASSAPAHPDSSGSAAFYLSGLPAGSNILSVTVTDSLGANGSAVLAVNLVTSDADGDGVRDTTWGGDDCNDRDASIYPGAPEACDGLDHDCDGAINENNSTDAHPYYADGDGDGYGDAASVSYACSPPAGMLEDASDCDDANAGIHPGAAENCDQVDQDCDGVIDNNPVDATIWYDDLDGDGYGDPTATSLACSALAGTVSDPTDCDDGDAATYPGATEVCDTVDQDCDGIADNNAVDAGTWYLDQDGDGAGGSSTTRSCTAPANSTAAATDCDDADGAIYPGATEICDGIDQDCDGVADDNAADAPTWYADADADGYGDASRTTVTCNAPTGYVSSGSDCDDADPATNPGATETDCNDPHDYNCDGSTGYADQDKDGFAACQECDDRDGAIHPGATEVCDGADNDCDGRTDDASAADASRWYADTDNDGYGDRAVSVLACSQPSGYRSDATDCSDADASIHPGGTEVCNTMDDDCDGSVDENAVDALAWYDDRDGDGYGDALGLQLACDAPTGTVADASDCDDGQAKTHPNASEFCNNTDDDCDGTIDENAVDATAWYTDADKDGYGDASTATFSCSAPSGTVADATDCDDARTSVHPGAAETCNSLDDNCNGSTDENATNATTWYADSDADGYGAAASSTRSCSQPTGYLADATDCDDSRASVHPGGTEVCNSLDDDCDGSTDESSAVGAPTWYADADGDSYGAPSLTKISCNQPSGYTSDSTDCDDSHASVHPGASETCNSTDDDCDGRIDEDATDATLWYVDADADGYGSSNTVQAACSQPVGYVADHTDCDDAHSNINPFATETCDGVDQDCDGTADENAVDASTWYADADGDGYGNSASTLASCSAPSGYVANHNDCDDAHSNINPFATETCDGSDNNCDGVVDESTATNASTWYIDSDGDGYGGTATTTKACSKPTGYAASSTDCNDAVASIHPGASESCNSADDDCDGVVDNNAVDAPTWYADTDGDGYGSSSSTRSCSQPSAYVANATDCNDGISAINPGAAEVCDAANTDEDCDGLADDADPSVTGTSAYYVDVDGDGYAGSTTSLRCDADSTHLSTSTDCNDGVASIHPNATEVCDASNTDEDCDGTGDEAGSSGCTDWYVDADADHYGTGTAACLCDSSGSYTASVSGDCDDTSALAAPGLSEVLADNLDNDCDGKVDEAGPEWIPTGDYDVGWFQCRTSYWGQASAYNGQYLAGGGDIDGDGYDDLLSGVPGEDYAGTGSGMVALYRGPIVTHLSSSYGAYGTAGDGVGPVALIPDINGDGKDEVLAGAPDDFLTSNYDGRAFLILGGSLTTTNYANSLATTTFKGSTTRDNFGQTVAYAGDTSGDGGGDLLISDAENLSTYAGKVYLFDGPVAAGTISTTAATTVFTAPANGDYAAQALASNGDLDGDGLTDVVMGAYLADGAGADAGAVYVNLASSFSGSTSVTMGTDVTLTGEAAGDQAGFSADIAGDVNGDGYDDLLIGAPGYSTTGRAYVVFGPPSSGSLSGADEFLNFPSSKTGGYAVSGVGDIDDDGTDDFAVTDRDTYGNVYLFYNASAAGTYSVTTDVDAHFYGSSPRYIGDSLSRAGDLDADGIPDFAIGAPRETATSPSSMIYAGRIYIVHGNFRRLTEEAISMTIKGASADPPRFGGIVSGDFNADSYSDTFVGGTQLGNSNEGGALLFLGPFSTTESQTGADGVYTGTGSSDASGSAVATGNFDGDAYADFVVGVPLDDTSVGADAGSLLLVYGASAGYSSVLTSATSLTGERAGDQFAYALAGGGDLDGDTYDDLVVGAPYHDIPAADAGRVYLYTAPFTTNEAAFTTIKGTAASDTFGYAVGQGGDVDGDGFVDMVIGAPGSDLSVSNGGAAYLFTSLPTGTVTASTADTILTGEVASDAAGTSVCIPGDLDGDGYADLLVGAPGNDDGAASAGAVYVLLGPLGTGTLSLSTADEEITGERSSMGIGEKVASAGDNNGDGLIDILFSGPTATPWATGYTSSGLVGYRRGPVVGGSTFFWSGIETNGKLGSALGSLGDVNGDGLDEYGLVNLVGSNFYGTVRVVEGE